MLFFLFSSKDRTKLDIYKEIFNKKDNIKKKSLVLLKNYWHISMEFLHCFLISWLFYVCFRWSRCTCQRSIPITKLALNWLKYLVVFNWPFNKCLDSFTNKDWCDSSAYLTNECLLHLTSWCLRGCLGWSGFCPRLLSCWLSIFQWAVFLPQAISSFKTVHK